MKRLYQDNEFIFEGSRKELHEFLEINRIDWFDVRKNIVDVVTCSCGEVVECWDSWYNTCECGQGFNGSGQRLAPPSQWGEETGERFSSEGSFIL